MYRFDSLSENFFQSKFFLSKNTKIKLKSSILKNLGGGKQNQNYEHRRSLDPVSSVRILHMSVGK